ncbi:MAG: VOC family protein [Pseudomonadota bacterium]
MLHLVSVGTDDLDSSIEFYDAVLSVLGMVRLQQNDVEVGYGTPDAGPVFFVNIPFNKLAATSGNGVQITFSARDRETVDEFYAKVLELGGSDEGAPGERDYSPGYYGAYCRDKYGNKLHVAHIPAP